MKKHLLILVLPPEPITQEYFRYRHGHEATVFVAFLQSLIGGEWVQDGERMTRNENPCVPCEPHSDVLLAEFGNGKNSIMDASFLVIHHQHVQDDYPNLKYGPAGAVALKLRAVLSGEMYLLSAIAVRRERSLEEKLLDGQNSAAALEYTLTKLPTASLVTA